MTDRRFRKSHLVAALGFLAAVAVIALFIVGIWTGDDRWGYTAAVLLIPGIAGGISALIVFLDGDI